MRKIIEDLLEKFGVDAVVKNTLTKIFLQFSNSKSWDSMNPILTPVGQIPGGQYLYIGPVDLEVAVDDEVEVGGIHYIMRRCEVYQTHEGPIYRWALCSLKGGDTAWGYQPSNL